MDQRLVLSTKKQTAYGTALTDANLQAGMRFGPGASFMGQIARAFWTDRNLAMKGHDYSTQRIEVMRDFQGSLGFPGDSWLAAWLAAFGMGAITSVQPAAGTDPNAWKHTIKPLDPSTAGKDLPVSTIYVEDAQTANLARRHIGCVVKNFDIAFPPDAPIEFSAAIDASGQVTTGILATPPALATLNLLLSNDLVFKYGTQAAPADISSQIKRGSTKFAFTWNMDEQNARAVGGGLFKSRAWVGTPHFSLEFQRYVDDAASTPQDDWLGETIQEALLQVDGALIAGGTTIKHSLQIRGLAVRPTVVALAEENGKTLYHYTIGPDDWLKQGAADVITIIVQNAQSAFLN